MTQIQALENLSQTDLVKLIQTERQQHADDMDMLAKELVSRALMIPKGWQLVPIEPSIKQATDTFVWIVLSWWWHRNKELPAVSLRDELQKQECIPDWFKDHWIYNADKIANFNACSGDIAALIYRRMQEISTTDEAAPTSAVKDSLTPASTCTCPSGDGSLRWPCPVHPPESVNSTESSYQHSVPLPKDEWIRQCAKRFIDRARTPKNIALEIAESCRSHMGDDYIPPEDAADEEMSNWTD